MKTCSGKFLVIAALCLASSGSLAEPLGCSFKDYSDTYKRDRAAFRALVTAQMETSKKLKVLRHLQSLVNRIQT